MPKKVLEGVIVSDKNAPSTFVVKVERSYRHPKYEKIIRMHDKYQVHNELENILLGDKVKIQESRPISKTKKWVILGKVEG
jgi:small subunit ribosomal protein S17